MWPQLDHTGQLLEEELGEEWEANSQTDNWAGKAISRSCTNVLTWQMNAKTTCCKVGYSTDQVYDEGTWRGTVD